MNQRSGAPVSNTFAERDRERHSTAEHDDSAATSKDAVVTERAVLLS